LHIYDDNFNEEAVHNITDLNTETLFNKTEIYNLIQNIRDIANKNKNKGVHFDVESLLSDTDYLNLTGIDRDSFDAKRN
jgi:hypothetical protein